MNRVLLTFFTLYRDARENHEGAGRKSFTLNTLFFYMKKGLGPKLQANNTWDPNPLTLLNKGIIILLVHTFRFNIQFSIVV